MAILAACGITTNPPDAPDEIEPPDDEQVEQHFCCSSVDLKNMTGENCVAINKEQINTCLSVLYCGNTWGKDNGTIACHD
ncbi:hypothetical protein DB30_07237 [Enhygromyxa salina]|uniref:Uncharacterized protein n=2 Tax=Enhygromyxa salina TaxID=215803 RepID=A0A0C2D6T7_9BACT|nr:hypothetical protein DB30_07237 [Enhygromyxa salina]